MSLVFPTLSLLLIRLITFSTCKRWISRSLSKQVLSPSSPQQENLPAPSTTPRHGGGEDKETGMSEILFCLCFSESCILLGLVLLGDLINETARDLNWQLSLAFLLFLVVILTPFLHCLIFTSPSATGLPRVILYTCVPFAIYLFVFYRLGEYLCKGIFTIETVSSDQLTSNAGRIHDLITPTLTRLLVPGIILISSLSGLGATNTIWDEWELRKFSRQPVTDGHILAAERALGRAREDRDKRERELQAVSREVEESRRNESKGFFANLMASRDSAVARQTSLSLQLSAMRELENQLLRDLIMLQKRKQRVDTSQTFQGILWSFVVRILEVWCIYRVIVSLLNLIFGYTITSTSKSNTEDPQSQGARDLTTKFLASFLPPDFPIHFYTRLFGLVMIGSILVATIRNVVLGVEGVFEWLTRNQSSTVKARGGRRGRGRQFVIMVLAQVMAIYLLTSLISLPSNPDPEESISLLDTLPSFKIFSKLFDAVFLVSAVGGFLWRWARGKVTGDRLHDIELG